MRYPPPDLEKPDKLANEVVPFCFPDIKETDKLFTEQPIETFSFILTNSDGSLRFGFCRRFLGDLPECYVLISDTASYSVFSQILAVIEESPDVSSSLAFLEQIYKIEMPKPGDFISVGVHDEEGEHNYLFSRADNAYEYLDYVSYGQLFSLLTVNNIEYLFDALLMTRRIVIVSSNLSVLSGCMLAVKHMVYPLDWQHIFIPILPETMIDYICAPMPFLIGILSSSMHLLSGLPIEEVVILDLDSGEFIQKPEWESFLPPTPTSILIKSLKLILRNRNRFEGRDFSQSVAHSFLRFWVTIWEGYPTFLKKSERFHLDDFIQSKPPEIQRLLQAIGKSRLCSVFYREQEYLIDNDLLDTCILTRAKFDDLGTFIRDSIPQQSAMKRFTARVSKKKSETKTTIGGRKVYLRCSILDTNKTVEKALLNGDTTNRSSFPPILEEDSSPRKFFLGHLRKNPKDPPKFRDKSDSRIRDKEKCKREKTPEKPLKEISSKGGNSEARAKFGIHSRSKSYGTPTGSLSPVSSPPMSPRPTVPPVWDSLRFRLHPEKSPRAESSDLGVMEAIGGRSLTGELNILKLWQKVSPNVTLTEDGISEQSEFSEETEKIKQ